MLSEGARLARVDRAIYKPERFEILSILSAGEGADALYLETITGLAPPALQRHLASLEQNGYVRAMPNFRGRTGHTVYCLTRVGRAGVTLYLKWLKFDYLFSQNPAAAARWGKAIAREARERRRDRAIAYWRRIR